MGTVSAALPARAWPRAAAVLVAAGALYALAPRLAPTELSGESASLALGLLNGLVVGVVLRGPAWWTGFAAAGAGAGTFAWLVSAGGLEWVSVVVPLAVALELLAIPMLVRRLGADRLDDPGALVRYGAAVLAVTVPVGLVSAAVAATDVDVGGSDVPALWRLWVIDDLFGLVVIAPAIILLHRPSRWSWRHPLEYVFAVAYTAAFTWYVFVQVEPGENGLFGWPYLVLLGSIWIAVRFGAAAVAPVLALQFWAALVSTAQGSGAFATLADPLDRILIVQMFAVIMSASILALGLLRDRREELTRQIQERSRFFQEVIDGSEAVIFAKSYRDLRDAGGRYVLANAAALRITGLSEAETIGRTDAELMPADVAERFVVTDREVLSSGQASLEERRVPWADGSEHVYSSLVFPLTDGAGHRWGVAGIATDITELIRARQREAEQAELLHAVFALSPTPALRIATDAEGSWRVTAANAAMCRLLDLPDAAPDRCDLFAHVHPQDEGAARDVILREMEPNAEPVPGARQREVRMTTASGRTVVTLMSAAGLHGVAATGEAVVQFEDITARRAAEQALSDQAMRDPVTGLPNRRALLERMDTALQRLRRRPGWVTVLFCDLDHFKDVNDSLGHQIGDRLLVEVADRLRSAVRPEDTVARIGGDEFVAMGEGIVEPADAMLMALRLQDKLNAPWIAGEQVFRPQMSVGIAMTRDPDVGVDEMLRRADLAMYRAKAQGRNRVEVYERAVDEEVQKTVAVQHLLRRAIDTDGLLLRYQPIVRLDDRAVVGMEALVRMQAPDGTVMSPAEFVPQAEATGLVVPLGAWVLRRALQDLERLHSVRGHDVRLSVNVSPTQLREPGFASFLLEQVELADVEPHCLSIEVTETALIHDPHRSGEELGLLHAAGIGIALDDFGTGYSSLSWLTQFPLDTVKVDKSFTDELGVDPRKSAIVAAVISVSHELGFSVVAEGIEDEAQVRRLVELGCDKGQGYLFGTPVPIGEPPWTL